MDIVELKLLKMNKTLTTIFLLLTAIKGFSQFTLTGELRPRIEYRDGYKNLLSTDQNAAFITTQRSRLNLDYKDERLAVKFSLQDIRTWGETAATKDASSFNIFEAWAEFYFTENLSIRLGRQQVAYDKNRLLGTRNWNQVGNSHDMILLQYAKDLSLQVGFAYNNDKSKNSESNYPVDFYKTLVFVRGEKDFGELVNISALFLNDGYQKEGADDTIYFRNTYGGNLSIGNSSVKPSFYGQYYYQSGKSQTGENIGAYFVSASLSYKLSEALSATAAIDYASGDDPFKVDNKKNSFSNLYGNGHSYYGYMDYFSRVDESTSGSGLMDIYARLDSKLGGKITGQLTYHYLKLTNNAIDSLSNPGDLLKADRQLGSEVDVLFKYKPTSNVEINLGYSAMFAKPTTALIKGGDHKKYQQWAWVMLIFKPELYTSKKQQ